MALLLSSARVSVPRPAVYRGPIGPTGESEPIGSVTRLPRRFWLAWLVLVLCIGIEFSMTIWAADLLVSRPVWALRRSPEWLLTGSLAITATGFLVFWSTVLAGLALLGLFVMGLGIAVQFPLSVARAITASAGRPDQATARLSIGAGLAIGLAPLLLGFLADQVGTRQAFLIVPVLLILAGAALLAGRR